MQNEEDSSYTQNEWAALVHHDSWVEPNPDNKVQDCCKGKNHSGSQSVLWNKHGVFCLKANSIIYKLFEFGQKVELATPSLVVLALANSGAD